MKLFSGIHRMRLTVLLLRFRERLIFGDCFVQHHCFDRVNDNRLPRMVSSLVFRISGKWDSSFSEQLVQCSVTLTVKKCFHMLREFPVDVCAYCLLSHAEHHSKESQFIIFTSSYQILKTKYKNQKLNNQILKTLSRLSNINILGFSSFEESWIS